MNEFYPNGISTSLPFDVQLRMVRMMPGLEHAHLLRPGYAIEYDYYDPRALMRSLETKAMPGSSLRGRSTATGYEGGRRAGASGRDQRGALRPRRRRGCRAATRRTWASWSTT